VLRVWFVYVVGSSQITAKMFVNEVNDVKIYNLSAGKSVPDVSTRINPLPIQKIQEYSPYSGSRIAASGRS